VDIEGRVLVGQLAVKAGGQIEEPEVAIRPLVFHHVGESSSHSGDQVGNDSIAVSFVSRQSCFVSMSVSQKVDPPVTVGDEGERPRGDEFGERRDRRRGPAARRSSPPASRVGRAVAVGNDTSGDEMPGRAVGRHAASPPRSSRANQ